MLLVLVGIKTAITKTKGESELAGKVFRHR